MEVDQELVLKLVGEFSDYGFWGMFALVFMIFGFKHVSAIISSFGAWHNERLKANLSHKRAMIKLENKESESSDRKGS